jgi:glycosyltransferase involved in cell wall biosynthesis
VTLEPPRPGLSGTLADFDVVLMPSRFEGFGLVAGEALLAGTPVVGTDAPGLREVLPPGYPLLAPVGDTAALARLLADVVADPGRFREMARALRGDIERDFGLPRMLEGYRRVYRGLARRGAGEIKHERARGT